MSAAPVVAQPSPAYTKETTPRRVALVLTNWNYDHFPDVASSKTDGERMESALERLDFEVSSVSNIQSYDDVERRALTPFISKVGKDDDVVVYYSGHGFSLHGKNYLAAETIDLNVSEEQAAIDHVSLELVIEALAANNPAHILFIYDACRTMPNFTIEKTTSPASTTNAEPQTAYQDHSTKGPTSPKIEIKRQHRLIHFATQQGGVALENLDEKTPSYFTAEILENIEAPNRDYVYVHQAVWNAMDRQSKPIPWLVNSSGFDYFPKITAALRQQQALEWQGILNSADPIAVEGFIRSRPLSPFVGAARSWLEDFAAGRLSTNRSTPTEAAPPDAVLRSWERSRQTGQAFVFHSLGSDLQLSKFAVRRFPDENRDDVELGVFDATLSTQERRTDALLVNALTRYESGISTGVVPAYSAPNLSAPQEGYFVPNIELAILNTLEIGDDKWIEASGRPIVEAIDLPIFEPNVWDQSRFLRISDLSPPVPINPGLASNEFFVNVSPTYSSTLDTVDLSQKFSRFITANSDEIGWVIVSSEYIAPTVNDTFRSQSLLSHAQLALETAGVSRNRVTLDVSNHQIPPGQVRFRVFANSSAD
ncbi:MAG: caspase family protein [Pseudomonadota bacterium]|nr:caspase family protein [Pseudomonadota bacterium]